MKVLLLAAGLGSRLKPITDTIPKCMAPIHGKPLIDFWLKMFENNQIESVLVNLHYLPDIVQDHILKGSYASKVTFVKEQKLLGTAGTLLANQAFFKEDSMMLVHADNLSLFDLDAFIDAHENRPKDCEITMMTFETDTPQSCGIVRTDELGVVQQFYEKVKNPPGNQANGAVFIIEPSVIGFMNKMSSEPVDFCADVLPCFMGKIMTFKNRAYHRDIGTVESYEQAIKDFKP